MKGLYSFGLLIFTYVYCFGQAPVISDFNPTSGPVGTSVTITGAEFSSTPSENIVYFGSVRTAVVSSSTSEITVTVPAGTVFQPVSVTVNGLTAYSSRNFKTTFPGGGFIHPTAFGNVIDFTTALESSIKIAIGDFDSDGKSDVAVVGSQGAYAISIFRNTSTGSTITFAPRVDIPLGANAGDIATGDLDGDGTLDLVVTCEPMHKIFVLRNVSTAGSISFEPKLEFATSQFPFDVSIDDLDLDGKPDLAVATEFGKVSVLRNKSSMGTLTAGSFDNAVNFTVATESLDLITRDLDGDGRPEIISTSANSNVISILRNNSSPGVLTSGSFASLVNFATGMNPSAIGAADFDGDNKPDIVVTNGNSNTISVFKNISTLGSITSGSFAAKVDFTTNNFPSAIGIADVDGDGKADLCISSESGAVSVFRNVSTAGTLTTGSFESKVDVVTSSAVYRHLAPGDLNNDGKPDLAFLGGKLFISANILGYPFISDCTPMVGEEGTIVTINGHNFDPVLSNNIVKFNGVPAIVSSGSATSLEVIVPTGATNGYITVEVDGQEFQSPSVFILPPVITSFTPSGGAIGSTVFISGVSFDPLYANNQVEFNGTPAVVVNSSETSLTVVVPENATTGPISVSVNSFAVTSASDFVIRQGQLITFSELGNNITMGDLPITLDATASSGLPVQFTATPSKVSIVGNQATLLSPGRVTVTANQSGDDAFGAADPVSKTFCIHPTKPRISLENADEGLLKLVSSSSTGNQWYHDGIAIAGETSPWINITEDGFYNVRVTVENCASQISDDLNLTITGVENEYSQAIAVYPVPAQRMLSVKLYHFDNGKLIDILVYNTMSQLVARKTTTVHDQHVDLDVSTLPQGVYIMQAGQGNKKQQIKFVKED